MNAGSKNTKELINIALGHEKADITIINAKLLNVYSGEILEGYSISIKGEWIAYTGMDAENTIGDHTKIIDAAGRTVIPGLIDGHTHLGWLFSINEFLKYAVPGGTTLIITETMEPYPVAGLDGVVDFLQSFDKQPIKILGTAPYMASISKRARGISKKDLQILLEREDIIGLGESYWQSVFQNIDQTLPLFHETLKYGKSLEGHSAGASGNKLAAYAAAGITSCHEPIRAEEVMERLRLGFYVMIREGSIRSDLRVISKIKDNHIDFRRLILVTDGVEPIDLIKKGYMDHVVQKAIDIGFNPVTAIQMATINAAEHFSIDHIVGGIAPGRYADLLIIPDINTITPEYVISNGKIVAKKGELVGSPRKHIFSKLSTNTIHLPGEFRPSDFKIHVPQHSSEIDVRVISMISDLVTREITETLPVEENEIKSNTRLNIIKIAAIDRTFVPGKTFVGLIKGFNLKSGAVASSAAWDTSDIIIVGVDDADMALAVNRIRALQGGVVVCDGGKVITELPLPVFGMISDETIPVLADQSKKVREAISGLGVKFPDPILTLITLTGAAIPFLRICEEGLVNLKDGETIDLFL